jgi:hypothetical protein
MYLRLRANSGAAASLEPFASPIDFINEKEGP